MHPLHTLFNPASIAVIGASRDAKSIRGRFVDFLARGGYTGRILPVNPSYPEVNGRECFPSVAAAVAAAKIPVDLALVAIPADAVLPELERCAAAGVRNALIVSSGFAEEGAERSALQARISAIARAGGMRVVGPNSEGFLNAVGRVSASFSPTVEYAWQSVDGGAARKRIAVLAQSGGMGFGIMHRGLAAGLAFSTVISTGNEADVSLADCLDYMVADPHTGAIVLFLESVRDSSTFTTACAHALAADKPIVAIKVGRSAAGQRAAASHTASIAGWSAAYDAVFARYGVVPCADTGEAIAALGILTTCPPLRGNRAAVLTGSGGAGALVSDALERSGFVLPVLSPGVQQTIRAFIPSYATAQNPVDVTAGTAHLKAVVRAADVLLAADEIDLLVTIHSFTSESSISFDPLELARAAAWLRQGADHVLLHGALALRAFQNGRGRHLRSFRCPVDGRRARQSAGPKPADRPASRPGGTARLRVCRARGCLGRARFCRGQDRCAVRVRSQGPALRVRYSRFGGDAVPVGGRGGGRGGEARLPDRTQDSVTVDPAQNGNRRREAGRRDGCRSARGVFNAHRRCRPRCA